jgi:hypothetical protein
MPLFEQSKFRVGDKVFCTLFDCEGVVVDPETEVRAALARGENLVSPLLAKRHGCDFYSTYPVRLVKFPETLWWRIGVLQLQAAKASTP